MNCQCFTSRSTLVLQSKQCGYPIDQAINHRGRNPVNDHRAGDGERADCRLWREEEGERVAAVGVQRRRAVAKAHTGHRNRAAAPWTARSINNFHISRCGGIGRHKGLKIPRSKIRTGSIPVSGTKKRVTPLGSLFSYV